MRLSVAKVQDRSLIHHCQRFRAESSNTHVTSLDFDDTGELAIVARDDDTLQIYNCKEGKHAKELKSLKYGCSLARFTHHSQSVLYASTKIDDAIRLLSTHDNSYTRYFRGHTDTVTSLCLDPSGDEFISCSLDNTVRFWSIKSPNPRGQLNLFGPHFAAYDPSASVVAIASPPTQTVLLYDVRNFERAPFAVFDLKESEARHGGGSGRNWSKLDLSNDGKSVLIGTTGGGHYVLDAFEGGLTHYLPCKGDRSTRYAPGEGNRQSSGRAAGQGDVCFSPDGRYVIGASGSGDGLLVWDLSVQAMSDDKRTQAVEELPVPAGVAGSCEIVGYNPRSNLICSADKDFMIWLPDPELAP